MVENVSFNELHALNVCLSEWAEKANRLLLTVQNSRPNIENLSFQLIKRNTFYSEINRKIHHFRHFCMIKEKCSIPHLMGNKSENHTNES